MVHIKQKRKERKKENLYFLSASLYPSTLTMTISPQLQPRGQIFYNFDFPSMASPYSKSQIHPPCCELKGLAGLGPWLAL